MVKNLRLKSGVSGRNLMKKKTLEEITASMSMEEMARVRLNLPVIFAERIGRSSGTVAVAEVLTFFGELK
jgi:hypothetical protein